MYPETEEPTDVVPANLISTAPVMDEYAVGGGAELIDEFSSIPLIVERTSLVPMSVGVAAYQRGDNGNLRNRLEISQHEPYEMRVFALTLVHNGPEYTGVIQHTMQENAEQFSIRTAQRPPMSVDVSRTLPYNTDVELGIPNA